MKEFSIRVTQKLKGHYEGRIVIEAHDKDEAVQILESMSDQEIDRTADWTHGDHYDGTGEITIDKTDIETL
jgi:hypothetical protein